MTSNASGPIFLDDEASVKKLFVQNFIASRPNHLAMTSPSNATMMNPFAMRPQRRAQDSLPSARIRSLSVIALVGELAGLGTACTKAPPQAAPAPLVMVQTILPKEVTLASEWLATLEGSVEAEIRPKVQSYITQVHYREGAVIKKGDLLFTLDSRQFEAAVLEAQGTEARAKAELTKNQTDVERYRPLVEKNAFSRLELEHAEAALAASQGQLRAVRGQLEQMKLNVQWCQVRAPIDGVAGIANRKMGSLVGPSDVLTTVSRVDPILANFYLNEKEYLQYADKLQQLTKTADSARFLKLVLPTGETYPETARLSVVGSDINRRTGTITLQASFANPQHMLRPGMSVRIRTDSRKLPHAITIPVRATQEIQGTFQAAVVGSDARVEIRTLKLGPQIDGMYVVQEGLNAGERIVVDGLQRVRPSMKVRAQEAPASTTKSDATTQASRDGTGSP